MIENNDIVCLRRARPTNRRKYEKPSLSVRFKDGEFMFYKKAAELMNIDADKEAFMFYLNRKNRTVKVVVEERQSDNYAVSLRAGGHQRFTAKHLAKLFSEVLRIPFESRVIFNVSKVTDKEFLLTLEDEFDD